MLTVEDQRDIYVYIKHFILKTCQSIVSSRYNIRRNETVNSSSTIASQFDWFNISISDYPVVIDQIKTLFNGNRMDLSQSVELNIFINTYDNKSLLIERWCISMIKKQEEILQTDWKVNFYNHLTAIIKSVLIVSRSSLVYRLCKLSSKDGYSVSYSIDFSSQLDDKTQEFNQQNIGVAICPIGTIEIHLFWKELQDFSMITSCKMSSNETEDVDTNARHRTINSNQASNLNGHVSLAYGHHHRVKRSPSLEKSYIPFNNLLNPNNKKMVTVETDQSENECLQTVNFDESIKNAENLRTFNQSEMLKKSACISQNIKTPFAFNKNDAQLFYQTCSEVSPLTIFDEMVLASPKVIELDYLLLTFKNNAKPFSNFINLLATMDT